MLNSTPDIFSIQNDLEKQNKNQLQLFELNNHLYPFLFLYVSFQVSVRADFHFHIEWDK